MTDTPSGIEQREVDERRLAEILRGWPNALETGFAENSAGFIRLQGEHIQRSEPRSHHTYQYLFFIADQLKFIARDRDKIAAERDAALKMLDQPTQSDEPSRVLLSEGLDLCVRARRLGEREVTGSHTIQLWVEEQYATDLMDWEQRARAALTENARLRAMVQPSEGLGR